MPGTITSATTPLLIFDGNCGFCYYWVRYWQKLTGDRVNYQPYQQVSNQFPELTETDFKNAIQYVAPNGKISRAAEASFLTLSNAPGKAFWLKLYRRLPGFAFFTEKAYTLIAKHRSLFYCISVFLWGKNLEPAKYNLVAWLFIRGMALIFGIAFFSFGIEALGLIGSHGIIPVATITASIYKQFGALAYWFMPMVFWINASDWMVQLTCWGGVLVSALLLFNILPRLALIVLYALYLSLCTAGLFFMSFQWDMFLLEAGVLTLFLYNWYKPAGILLLRWLLFRFVIGAGLVKILSGDPTWQNLSALKYYFNTEPLPTPLAWYANLLPSGLLTFGAGFTLYVELIIPFLIFFPRNLRFFAAFNILFLQFLILITGNYNFFNIQTMLLCLILFDDAALRKILPASLCQRLTQQKFYFKPNVVIRTLAGLFIAITVFVSIDQLYLRFGGSQNPALIWANNSIAPLRLVNVYGPFAVITTHRYEIILEGSNDGNNWQDYDFKYKPGNLFHEPRWNIPLQPRLDWQMWFAALGSMNNNPWLLNVAQRLLENSPTVTALLATNPFADKAPQFIRAELYDYQFTNDLEKAKTGAWWKRIYVGNYLPSVHL